MYGADIDMLLLSGAGAEGLDLKNIRSLHIMEPYWNYARIKQTIGRAVRRGSHSHFDDEKDKTVQPYIYLSDYPNDYVFKPTKTKKQPEKTTDVHLYTKSVKGKRLIDRLYAVMLESSIDCPIHLKKSPDIKKKKINCLICTPTNNTLFNTSPLIDLKLKNPCEKPTKINIKAEQIIYNGKEYYYTKSSDNIISIYEYRKNIDSYVELDRSHPNYHIIIKKLSE